MAWISQFWSVWGGGVTGGVFNSIFGVRQVSGAAFSNYFQGYAFGALSGIATNIIHSRTERLKKSYNITTVESLMYTHLTAYVCMILSWHGARYVSNRCLDLNISHRTVIAMSVAGFLLGTPIIGIWTYRSYEEPEDMEWHF